MRKSEKSWECPIVDEKGEKIKPEEYKQKAEEAYEKWLKKCGFKKKPVFIFSSKEDK